MLRWISRLILISALCGPSFVRAGDVDFPDANLDTVIREILKKKQIDKSDKTKKITEEDLATIFFLEAPSREIEDLSGLEKCRNLALIKLNPQPKKSNFDVTLIRFSTENTIRARSWQTRADPQAKM